LTETAKSDGNVRLSELAILALAACEGRRAAARRFRDL